MEIVAVAGSGIAGKTARATTRDEAEGGVGKFCDFSTRRSVIESIGEVSGECGSGRSCCLPTGYSMLETIGAVTGMKSVFAIVSS